MTLWNRKTFYFIVFFSNNSLRGIVLESKFWLPPSQSVRANIFHEKVSESMNKVLHRQRRLFANHP
jgi:hypothetical protein